jgi:hypothetical protein
MEALLQYFAIILKYKLIRTVKLVTFFFLSLS